MEPAGVVGTPKIGGPIKLTDQNGKIFDSTELKDKFMLVYFGFTHCPDVCPEELDKMTTVMKIVGIPIFSIFTHLHGICCRER